MLAMAGALVLMWFSSVLFFNGFTHKGTGYWQSGGAKYGDQVEISEHTDRVSQGQYRRNCLGGGCLLLVIGVGLMWDGFKKWSEHDGHSCDN